VVAGSSKKTKLVFKKLDTFVHESSRINLQAQLMDSIGGVLADTRYIQFFLSFS